jgi:hypothetical protein
VITKNDVLKSALEEDGGVSLTSLEEEVPFRAIIWGEDIFTEFRKYAPILDVMEGSTPIYMDTKQK